MFDTIKMIFLAIIGLFIAKKVYDNNEEKEDLKDSLSQAKADSKISKIKEESAEAETESLKNHFIVQDVNNKIEDIKVKKGTVKNENKIHYTVTL
jgi:hypothetical protein